MGPGYPPKREEEWISVLKLSTMWEFEEIRKVAIKELAKVVSVDLVRTVNLAKQYHIAAWLPEAYEGLIRRTEAISIAEAEQLGLSTAVRLFQIREKTIARLNPRTKQIDPWGNRDTIRTDNSTRPFAFDRTGCVCSEDVRKEFAEELKEAGKPDPEQVLRLSSSPAIISLDQFRPQVKLFQF